jgi:hypothetical protein
MGSRCRGLAMHYPSLPVGIVAIGLLAGATAAQAGIETWVSGTGTDAGTCPITAPCQTFAYAHNQTNNNGAINVLTSGNFGPVTISKSISIVADGVEAVINTSSNGAGVIVNANAGAIVSLRGLTIDMRGSASFGGLHHSPRLRGNSPGAFLRRQRALCRGYGRRGAKFRRHHGPSLWYCRR